MGTVSQQSGLAKKITLAQNSENFWFRILLGRLKNFYLAFFDDAEDTGQVSLPVNEIARAIISVIDLLGRIGIEETDIAWKDYIPRPVQSDFRPA